jgi:hypothetical protein
MILFVVLCMPINSMEWGVSRQLLYSGWCNIRMKYMSAYSLTGTCGSFTTRQFRFCSHFVIIILMLCTPRACGWFAIMQNVCIKRKFSSFYLLRTPHSILFIGIHRTTNNIIWYSVCFWVKYIWQNRGYFFYSWDHCHVTWDFFRAISSCQIPEKNNIWQDLTRRRKNKLQSDGFAILPFQRETTTKGTTKEDLHGLMNKKSSRDFAICIDTCNVLCPDSYCTVVGATSEWSICLHIVLRAET